MDGPYKFNLTRFPLIVAFQNIAKGQNCLCRVDFVQFVTYTAQKVEFVCNWFKFPSFKARDNLPSYKGMEVASCGLIFNSACGAGWVDVEF